MLICRTCKTKRHYDCEIIEYHHPKSLCELVDHVSSFIMQIEYDASELNLTKLHDWFGKEIEIFKEKADTLETDTIDIVQKGQINNSYRKMYAKLYVEAECLKEQILKSQMFQTYQRFIAVDRIDRRLFNVADRTIGIRDRDLGPRLREGLQELQREVEMMKEEEVKKIEHEYAENLHEIKQQYEGVVQAQKQEIEVFNQLISDKNDQWSQKAKAILDMITKQQKNFQKIQLNPNAIQQNLITLTESNEQENSNPSTLFEKIEIIIESLTVHIN